MKKIILMMLLVSVSYEAFAQETVQIPVTKFLSQETLLKVKAYPDGTIVIAHPSAEDGTNYASLDGDRKETSASTAKGLCRTLNKEYVSSTVFEGSTMYIPKAMELSEDGKVLRTGYSSTRLSEVVCR